MASTKPQCPNCHHDLDDYFKSCKEQERRDADFLQLLELCDLDPQMRKQSRAIRPEDDAGPTSPGNIKPHWEKALRMIYNTICRGGEISLKEGLGSSYYESESSWEQKKSVPIRQRVYKNVPAGLRAVAAVLYEQECSGRVHVPDMNADYGRGLPSSSELRDGFVALFNQMARLDYGIGNTPVKIRDTSGPGSDTGDWKKCMECAKVSAFLMRTVHTIRLGKPPTWNPWSWLGDCMTCIPDTDPGDIATMLYHFESHSDRDPHHALSGYTGVLQEMINDVPERGTDGLLRKLSTDVNLFHQWGETQPEVDIMGLEAERIADENGLKLWSRTIPYPRPLPPNGMYTPRPTTWTSLFGPSRWAAWFDRVGYRDLEPYVERSVAQGRIEAMVAKWKESTRVKEVKSIRDTEEAQDEATKGRSETGEEWEVLESKKDL